MNKDVKLYECRISAQLQPTVVSLGRTLASWPLAKLTVFKEGILLNTVFQEVELPFPSIQRIEKHLLRIQIHHNLSNVHKSIFIGGFINSSKLFKELTGVIKNNNIAVNIQK